MKIFQNSPYRYSPHFGGKASEKTIFTKKTLLEFKEELIQLRIFSAYKMDPAAYYRKHPEQEKLNKDKIRYHAKEFGFNVISRQEAMKRSNNRPEVKAKLSIKKKKYWDSHPEEKEQVTQRNYELWGDSEKRTERVSNMKGSKKALTAEEQRFKNQGEATRAKWQDPFIQKKLLAGKNKPEVKKRLSESFSNHWKNPETREVLLNSLNTKAEKQRRSDAMKKNRQDPEFTKKWLEAQKSSQKRGLLSQRMRERWEDPIKRLQLLSDQRRARTLKGQLGVSTTVHLVDSRTNEFINIVDPNAKTPEELLIEEESEASGNLEDKLLDSLSVLKELRPDLLPILTKVFGSNSNTPALEELSSEEQEMYDEALSLLREALENDETF